MLAIFRLFITFLQRQIDAELCKFSFHADDVNPSFVGLDYLVYKVQAQAESGSSVPVVAFLILGTSLLT